MKNSIKIIALGLCLAVTFTACDLDVVPPADMAAENFWKTEKDAWYALNSCYAELDGCMLYDECCTDNAHSHKPWEGNMEQVQQNGLSASVGYGSYYFGTVRMVNNFLANVEACNMDEALKERMKAEARFFRAWSYVRLTSFFGKVPIITEVLAYDAPNVERNSVADVQKFILDELVDIAGKLPESYKGGYLNEIGRITRWGALALRARAALYFGNYAEAEASAKQVMNSGHSLFRLSTLNAAQQKEADEMDAYIDFEAKGINRDKFVKGMFSYEALWFDENANPENPEYLVTREYAADANNYDWIRYTYMIPNSMSLYDGYISFEPMQDLVDAYWDVDGKTLRPVIDTNTRAGNFAAMWEDFTDDNGNCSQVDFQNKVKATDLKQYAYMDEFRNRDSRLYASLMFPFKGWHELQGKEEFYFMYNPKNFGNDGNESWSGYAFRKMVALEAYAEWTSSCDYPAIRYAEVLLTYAEAHIQTVGWDESVRTALNDLRDRCGMPDVPVSLSKEEAIDFVRNERRIELAGEGQRFQDVRRYGEEYCRKYMNGATYSPSGDLLIEKTWNSRLMLMPIPQEAIDFNPLLKDDQNPGY